MNIAEGYNSLVAVGFAFVAALIYLFIYFLFFRPRARKRLEKERLAHLLRMVEQKRNAETAIENFTQRVSKSDLFTKAEDFNLGLVERYIIDYEEKRRKQELIERETIEMDKIYKTYFLWNLSNPKVSEILPSKELRLQFLKALRRTESKSNEGQVD